MAALFGGSPGVSEPGRAGLIAALSVRMVWDDYRFEETSPGIGVPAWWYSIWLPIVSLAIALRAIGLFVRRGRKHKNNDQQDAAE